MISAEGRYCSNRVLMLTRVKKGCCHYLEAEGAVTVKKKKKRHLYGPLMRSTHSHCVRKASWHQYVCQFMIIDVRVSERKLTRKNPP